jgi:Folate receptor family
MATPVPLVLSLLQLALLAAFAGPASAFHPDGGRPGTAQWFETHQCPLTGRAEADRGYTGRCTWYNEKTCCILAEGGLPTRFDLTQDEIDSIPSAQCDPVSRKCNEAYTLLSCRLCSPDQKDWTTFNSATNATKEKVCKDFAERLYADCAGDTLDLTPVGGKSGCAKFSDFSDAADMVKQLGFDFADNNEDCFAAAAALSPGPLCGLFAGLAALALAR